MGTYLNPGNRGFERIISRTYVDKTGLIGLINQTIGTPDNLICISRPRRFGKSFAAQMLCSYYDKTCDSSGLFHGFKISGDETYERYLNHFDVIYLDMTGIIGAAKKGEIVPFIIRNVTQELLEAYPDIKVQEAFFGTLANAVEVTGNPFIIIIDEWDAPIREAESEKEQRQYLEFLRSVFKNSGVTAKIIAAAYMTGILPIKKDGSQSAISDFQEYSMTAPLEFAEYVGFTENEVHALYDKYQSNFEKMKQWYDGYSLNQVGSVYNPNSVMRAIRTKRFSSYWIQTSAADSLMKYISLDYEGLSKTIAELSGGIEIPVDTQGFSNDLITFHGKDDVLTLLTHLGYLAYDEDTQKVHIPNEEIRLEFAKAIRQVRQADTLQRVRESDQLIFDTVQMKEDAVAAQIEKIHIEETTPLFYNNEQALRSVIKLAYFSYKDYYLKFEELPSGNGCVDIVYFPKKDAALPALLIELKWNKSASGAINQIKDRHYPEALEGYGGELLLVEINYDKDAPAGQRKHTCIIEKYLS
ncbi:MAG: AAA family ATPase [Blautia sp.]|nr:AAA family ATPase [Blautia sp.]